MGHLHKKTKKAKILIITKDFGFLILLRFYLLCFLLKTAIAIPLKKSRKRKINVFLMGSCFRNLLFFTPLGAVVCQVCARWWWK